MNDVLITSLLILSLFAQLDLDGLAIVCLDG